MQLSFYGATKTVTGSKTLLTYDTKRVLIDCGLFQGYKDLRLRNWNKLPLPPRNINAVILTHAHIDHSGYLPLLAKHGFTGPIYATPATRDLCAILLPDSGRIQEEDAKFANKHGYSKHKVALPLYTEKEAEKVLKQFVTLDFNQPHSLGKNGQFTFLPAGHILGASFVHIKIKESTFLFSGDLGRFDDPIMCDPTLIDHTDYLILESTYGDRLHEATSPIDELGEIIRQTAKRGGSVIIPAFAVGRAQNILYYLYQLKQKNAIPHLPIFVDSPMATRVTQLLPKFVGEHCLSKKECQQISDIATYVDTPEESRRIDNLAMPSIIISASGMATGGRVLHHLRALAPHPRNTILFAGFQAGGTRGARLLRGEKEIKIHGQMVPIHADVKALTNTSAHADYGEILKWLAHFKKPPKTVFITHGEELAALALKERIEKTFHWHCVLPDYLQSFDL